MKTQVILLETEEGDADWPFPVKLTESIAKLEDLLACVPAEYRDDAWLNIDSAVSYDTSSARIEVAYTRPETAEETERRQETERRRKELETKWELRQLESLQIKYGFKKP
jgi:hypothetical protein